MTKQMGINNGKKLFQTGYKAPPYDPPDPNNPLQATDWQQKNYLGGNDDNNKFHFCRNLTNNSNYNKN